MELNYQLETTENPKMLEGIREGAYHQAFCYALAAEDKKLLMTIISGSDSAIQSLKASIDMGTYGGLQFGYGIQDLTGYKFEKEKPLSSDKGKYEKFSMTLNQDRKALAFVHEDVLNNSKYVLSFDGYPAKDIAQLLGGAKYGLHILPEWEETVLEELQKAGYLKEHPLYFDQQLFPNGLTMYSIDLEEEQADRFIEELLKDNKISFPGTGDGSAIEEIEDLTSYLMQYNGAMIEKLSKQVQPTHNPLEDDVLQQFENYNRTLFPVQAHAATAIAKRLKSSNKCVILQGEMSTGKSSMMSAIADGIHFIHPGLNNKKGYFACVMCPPSLTNKWPDEIRVLIPNAEVIVVRAAKDLIEYHQNWTKNGRLKPDHPVFFVISFTTMRNDAAIRPAVSHTLIKTVKQAKDALPPYKEGIYCPSCGMPHQTIEDTRTYYDENGEEQVEVKSYNMTEGEFGDTRRLTNSVKPANAFCSNCGESLWTKKVINRYESFSEWSKHEKELIDAILSENPLKVEELQESQIENPSSIRFPRRLAVIEYIRRKCKNFFDISIVDEVHELKGGMTAQGNALGSLVAASKKVIAGTGTLFGGRAFDVYYLLWRLFPTDMVKNGYKYEDVTRFNEEFGNIEETFYQSKESVENSNKQSRGGQNNSRKKLVPGISPFIYGKFMLQNVVNVRLKDVWPDPVELVDTPTIFVPMDEELKKHYQQMTATIEHAINTHEKGRLMYTLLTDYGIAYPDNPFTFPNALFKNEKGERELIWEATHIDESVTLPKEKKLQEIIENELSEGRRSIVYVRDTGSTTPGRDLRPRLKQKLEEIEAKVCILDTTTVATNKRSEWLAQKINEEGYDVCIVSQELVKVGLDLLCTPTLIYYQFSWSLFTINQSSRRSYRIGQDEECRLFYLAYENTYQEYMAEIIAKKNQANAAISGEATGADGLSAMLGDSDDLQALLIKAVKDGGQSLKGTAEEWISQTSDRAREILSNIGKKKKPKQIPADEVVEIPSEPDITPLITQIIKPSIEPASNTEVIGVSINEKPVSKRKKTKRRRTSTSEEQITFDLFG
ncbi:DEAD/DEAH box helicase [Rummeliibacillus stabekisii]|uniref:DEAD/DEAH box helicase n=1 Tax=Rummeliibacillus stabekisii TaxID=241244 RepID=UPI00203BC4F5|nr:DEAD/DEAH box helicase [Rummeliibacillus stabekisii]MCM3318007.1 DEAD/DEAH box helicase [Rummeliibacillus stabekisii]